MWQIKMLSKMMDHTRSPKIVYLKMRLLTYASCKFTSQLNSIFKSILRNKCTYMHLTVIY